MKTYKTDYEKKSFKDNIKTCTDRTLLGWLEDAVIRLKKIVLSELEDIEKMVKETKKRLKVDDHKAIRSEKFNPETKKWEEK